ncbi:MAG TPA: hypothetical protein VNS09_21110 [Solirubrobacter sp.]|nr:hypothetical protein [Solirubrobacter sp.]
MSSTASACTASAFISDTYNEWVNWSGNAVGCYSTWTYSWRIRLYKNGTVLDEHVREGLGGSTSYSTPSYSNFEIGPVRGQGYSTTFFIYHSATVGNNKVDQASRSL